MSSLFAALFLLIPAGLLWLTHHYNWASKVGIIVLCYVAGLVLGNTGLIPPQVHSVQQTFVDASVLLALPLLLFSLDIREWKRIAGKAMLSMLFATSSVVTLSTCLFFAFRDQGSETASHFAAMSVGVYTGGTPNLAAIKTGLEIPDSQYIVFHSLDTIAGAIYLLLMLTLGVPLFRSILKRDTSVEVDAHVEGHAAADDNYGELLERSKLPQMVKAIILSATVVGLALGLSKLLAIATSTQPSAATVIIAVTTLSILLSLNSRVRDMFLSYKLGMYLIYVFSFVVASLASLENLARVDTTIAVFLFGTIVGSLLLHAALCKLARIDSDTFMVTSVAAVCSPPFVPMMTRALGNPGALHSGMTAGIIGYALGNYLGISLALFLQGL